MAKVPPPKKPAELMIKTSIDLTADQYQYLKTKALDSKMKGQDPSFVTILRELIDEHSQDTSFLDKQSTVKRPKERMIKTSIDLAQEHYQFLKMKGLERKMKGQSPSFVNILRELIDEDKRQHA